MSMTTFNRLTPSQITQLYLYNSLGVPDATQRLDSGLIRPVSQDERLLSAAQVYAQSYMTTGGGRFARGPLFDLVQRFFDASSELLPPGIYTRSMLQEMFSLGSTLSIAIKQMEFADSVDDWAERTYIYNSGNFSVADTARFVVEPDGTRHIEQFAIVPRQDEDRRENFDLVSSLETDLGSAIAYLGNQYLGANIDPSGIGRKVFIDFVGPVATRDYSRDDYQNDRLFIQSWSNPLLSPLDSKAKIDALLDVMWADGTIKHLDTEQRPILYASGNDIGTIDWLRVAANRYFGPYIANGAHLIGSDEADNIEGSLFNDYIVGGTGADTLDGAAGDDSFIMALGDGDDLIDGSAGTDTVVYTYAGGNSTIKLVDDPLLAGLPFNPRTTPADFGLEIAGAQDAAGQSGSFGTDALSSIEKAAIEAGSGADTLVVTADAELDYLSYVDLGGQAATAVDTVDLRGLSGENKLDLIQQRLEISRAIPLTGGLLSSNDTLDLRGAEALQGGSGRDTLVFGAPVGQTLATHYAFDGGAGQDVLDLRGTSTATQVDLSAVQVRVGGAKIDLRNVEQISTGAGDDVLLGGRVQLNSYGQNVQSDGSASLANVAYSFDAGAGNDVLILNGGGAGSTLIGGEGRDFIYNRSVGGVIYGDTVDGLDAQGNRISRYGASTADNIWWSAGTTLMDANPNDVLKYYGLALTGGDSDKRSSLGNGTPGLRGLFSNYFVDHLFPQITYLKKGNDLYVIDELAGFLTSSGAAASVDGIKGAMKIKDFAFAYTHFGSQQSVFNYTGENQSNPSGDLGMVFKRVNPIAEILALLPPTAIGLGLQLALDGDPMIDTAYTLLAATRRYAKAMAWADGADPLVLDLDGDGLETIALEDSAAYFDGDGDLFAERTGWLGGDDGFLVLDKNANGLVDDGSELFGSATQGGFAALSAYDSNGDGKISAADAMWNALRVWQDKNSDGASTADELKSLAALGIVSINLGTTALGVTTPQGTQLLARGSFTRADGSTGRAYDAIFDTNATDTRYTGERGAAPWAPATAINAKGFGRITDLSVAVANDVALDALLQTTAASMRAPKLKTLRAQSGALLGAWGMTLEQSRELTPVQIGSDAGGKTVLLDRGVYVEDASGGYWTLHSGASVLDAGGNVIARPTLEQLLGQDAGWRLEQAWSPSARGTALQYRHDAPYLTQVVNGRAVILDYGIENADGSWRLASGAVTSATRAEILARPRSSGQEWRTEALGANPLANLPVAAIGVRFIDGQVVDYTVQVTLRHAQGQSETFTVWARNLDYALELEWKTGDSREFNLRGFAARAPAPAKAGGARPLMMKHGAKRHSAFEVSGCFQPLDINHVNMVNANDDDFCTSSKNVTDTTWIMAA
jgi:hypothetical protein